MRTLTNDYRDCEMLNLGYNWNGRGPFLIRQDGIPPGRVAAEADTLVCGDGQSNGFKGVQLITVHVALAGGFDSVPVMWPG